jgi:hypothetical protein
VLQQLYCNNCTATTVLQQLYCNNCTATTVLQQLYCDNYNATLANVPGQAEPGEASATTGNTVTAQYQLTVSGLTPGRTYITYRYPNRLPTGWYCPTACKWVLTVYGAPGPIWPMLVVLAFIGQSHWRYVCTKYCMQHGSRCTAFQSPGTPHVTHTESSKDEFKPTHTSSTVKPTVGLFGLPLNLINATPCGTNTGIL